ncbi:GNAT family N-acetyltransferase [Spiribacter sp. C176]|uniref:GNAT family N-acetyltransferase n=1 Tax=Spiribacter salilacus TaxID=2664894 RepID=A0A6N7QSY3_9GAMM|nr:GNAT family N-acetyltransferase [Spiribacter salilacus]MRH78503.1 GNAT family N-acetyltransferase [Spiribacter salilacus]
MTRHRSPRIHKAKEVRGKTLSFRDISVEDAPFILSLRTDEQKSRYLSATPPDLTEQRLWLQEYNNADGQAYFIIEYQQVSIGTVRLYDARDSSFCWGSWVLVEHAPVQAAIESALMVYAYGTDHLGFTAAHFDVRKANQSVWQFHERFGAQRIAETDLDYFYTLAFEAIQSSRKRYRKFLPDDVSVSG